MTLIAATAFIIPFLLSLVLTRAMIRVAPRVGLIDLPNQRKVHVRATPLGGGVAIYLAVVASLAGVVGLAWLVATNPQLARNLPGLVETHAAGVLSSARLLAILLAAATIQMTVGLVDDIRRGGLSWQLRLTVEVVLVLVIAAAGVRVSVFNNSWLITAPLTVLWIVGLTNALNFLDNMDALCGGVSFIASVFFAAIAYLLGNLFVFGCFVVLAGALLGFLRWNWNPARIFMGDAGSNFLGFWLGVLTVSATFHTESFSHVTICAPLCVLAVPIYDSTSVVLLRLAQGKSPFEPDKQHFSHRLVALGFGSKSAVMVIYLVTATTSLGGLLLYFLPAAAALLVLFQVLCIFGIIALLEVAAHRRAAAISPAPGASSEGEP